MNIYIYIQYIYTYIDSNNKNPVQYLRGMPHLQLQHCPSPFTMHRAAVKPSVHSPWCTRSDVRSGEWPRQSMGLSTRYRRSYCSYFWYCVTAPILVSLFSNLKKNDKKYISGWSVLGILQVWTRWITTEKPGAQTSCTEKWQEWQQSKNAQNRWIGPCTTSFIQVLPPLTPQPYT